MEVVGNKEGMVGWGKVRFKRQPGDQGAKTKRNAFCFQTL